jgi:hypothetical protein
MPVSQRHLKSARSAIDWVSPSFETEPSGTSKLASFVLVYRSQFSSYLLAEKPLKLAAKIGFDRRLFVLAATFPSTWINLDRIANQSAHDPTYTA